MPVVTPSPATVALSTVAPTVILGSVTVTPSPSSASLTAGGAIVPVASSFRGHTFKERGQDARAWPTWDVGGVVVVKKIAGSRKSVIQIIGSDRPRLGLIVRVTAAELADLYDQRGREGTLDFSFERTTAQLESIDSVAEQSAGHDTYFATLHFLRSEAF